MEDAPAPEGLPPSLRVLKGLVMVLTLTLIVGVIIVVAAIVTRMPRMGDGMSLVPAQIVLPAGAQAVAFTQGAAWYAVVTTDDRILIFDRASGVLRQTVVVAVAAEPAAADPD